MKALIEIELTAQPLGKPLALKKSNYTKLEEAIMQVCFYTWSCGYNVAFLVKQDWFWHPIICFLDGFPRSVIEYGSPASARTVSRNQYW